MRLTDHSIFKMGNSLVDFSHLPELIHIFINEKDELTLRGYTDVGKVQTIGIHQWFRVQVTDTNNQPDSRPIVLSGPDLQHYVLAGYADGYFVFFDPRPRDSNGDLLKRPYKARQRTAKPMPTKDPFAPVTMDLQYGSMSSGFATTRHSEAGEGQTPQAEREAGEAQPLPETQQD